MDKNLICTSIVECFPYPIVFVDSSHTIRYLNRAARFHYCEERGHCDLIGRSLFDCHFQPASRSKMEQLLEFFKKDCKETFLAVTDRNLRVYVSPVRDESGSLIGYYERFEMNFQK